MSKSSARSLIRLRGVRQNNLKNFDLDLPLNQLIVITGLSGSGKSSLAFDTLFAEGQRRYIETFSPYARQFFDRMDKPQVDSVEGIPAAIAIEQRNAVRTTRSTVGTMTEICDHMKMLWPHVAQLHCRQCGQPVRKDSPQAIWSTVFTEHAARNADLLITFDLPLTEKLSLEESLALISKQGYQRLLFDGQILRLDEVPSLGTRHSSRVTHLTVIQDRLRPTDANRARFIEACEQAYHFGKGKLAVHELAPEGADSKLKTQNQKLFSNRFHCAQCDIEYREPTPALFSFNHPLGACPTCRGFGRIISIDYDLALPDRSKTLGQGAVKPWQSGHGTECQTDLLRMCRHFEIPTDVPFEKLPKKWQDFVIEGEPGYGKDEEHEWPRAWYGVKGYFRWLESRAYKMHVRVLLSRYRAYTQCPDCHGTRFQPEALLYRIPADSSASPSAEKRDRSDVSLSPSDGESVGLPSEVLLTKEGVRGRDSLTLADFYQLPIRDALEFIATGVSKFKTQNSKDPLSLILSEVHSRLGYLHDVGLGYLTLDRPTRSLSGGETERVNLTTCLGTRLVNTLFVLDEPSVGLHPRDTDRLVCILQQLRDAGNTVVVVEHEASVMRAANQLVDLGPGHGAGGGHVVFQGTYGQMLKSRDSLTGQYLSGRKQIEVPTRRRVGQSSRLSPFSSRQNSKRQDSDSLILNDAPLPSKVLLTKEGFPAPDTQEASPALILSHASRHNLKDLSVEIPLRRFVCVTGVSGSGKTTLMREILLPALTSRLKSQTQDVKASDRFASEQNGDDQDDASTLDPRPSTLLKGWEHLDRVILVDQAILGKTPRSNPAVYIGAFDDIREFFAQTDLARQRGLNASAFSFNSAQGQCERCRGAGFEKIEMQFLSDVFIRCPSCEGRRYRPHILEVKVSAKSEVRGARGEVSRDKGTSHRTQHASRSLSIADLLDATIEEAVDFLSAFLESRPAQRAVQSLKLLGEVGLGYLKLGQPINTLSGGESQRLKLVRHLAEAFARAEPSRPVSLRNTQRASQLSRSSTFAPRPSPLSPHPSTLFLFDEPTTGLHFDDVRVLLKVFQRLVDGGHSVLVIEHNLDVIKSADWLIDLGPEAGDQGGELVAQGTPEAIAACERSHTGKALRDILVPERAFACR